MKTIFHSVAIFLIPLFLIHSWLYIVSPVVASAKEDIPVFAPETAEPKPEKIEAPKEGISGWWYVLAVVAIGGGVAAALGSPKEEPKQTSPIGNVTVSW